MRLCPDWRSNEGGLAPFRLPALSARGARMHTSRLVALLVVLAVAGCARPPERPRPPEPEQIPNLSTVKSAIKEYRSSGRWEADIDRVADDCVAAAQHARSGVERPAVVFDIDETLLSNWPYLIANDFARLTPRFVEWARRAECPPIEPVKRFFVTMRDAGIACFLITGRRENLRTVTERNLEHAGLTGWRGIAFRPVADDDPSIVPFKSGERAKIEQQGYTIVANIGDQESDLEGGHALHVCKVPNPMYLIP